MSVGLLILFGVTLLVTSTVGVPLRSSGPGLMRTKDGKPRAMPLLEPPVALQPSLPQPQRLDMQALARRYIEELLTQQIKLQMDKTNLEKFVTEMLMWRKRNFPSPAFAAP